jgi:hypothetical protein
MNSETENTANKMFPMCKQDQHLGFYVAIHNAILILSTLE